MLKRFLIAVLAGIAIISGAASTAFAFDGDHEGPHVILVTIDGLAAYHLENEELELPNLRELMALGTWAEASETVFPSVTHPSHATLTTGVSPRKHGVLDNWMVDRETGERFHASTRTRDEIIRVRTLFDAADEAGMTTAAFGWPETLADTSIDFNLPHAHDKTISDHVHPELLNLLREAGIPIDTYYGWSRHGAPRQGFRDIVMAEAASEIIRRHQPEFVAVYLGVTDANQHAWGPEHYLAHAALTQADYTVSLLRQAVRDAGLEERTTFIIAADHGFHSIHHDVNIHPLLAASGLDDIVRLHGHRWSVYVEMTDNFNANRDGAALEEFFEDLLRLDGLSRIIRPEEFHEIGIPRYEESPYVAGQYIIIPDIDTYLLVDPSSKSTERRRRAQPYHGHGYLPSHPRMTAALVLSGSQVKQGHRIGRVRNHDVAPTVAEILGLRLPDVEGRVLTEALVK